MRFGPPCVAEMDALAQRLSASKKLNTHSDQGHYKANSSRYMPGFSAEYEVSNPSAARWLAYTCTVALKRSPMSYTTSSE